MSKRLLTVSAIALFVIACVGVSTSHGSSARTAQAVAHWVQSAPRIDVQRLLAGLAAANLANNSPNPLEDVVAPLPEQIASANPWTLGIEAGSDDGGNNHCYLNVGGVFSLS